MKLVLGLGLGLGVELNSPFALIASRGKGS